MSCSFHRIGPATLLAIGLSVAGLSAGARKTEPGTADRIRGALLLLPYSGVFDFLSYQVDQGTVTLEGYAYGNALAIENEVTIDSPKSPEAHRQS